MRNYFIYYSFYISFLLTGLYSCQKEKEQNEHSNKTSSKLYTKLFEKIGGEEKWRSLKKIDIQENLSDGMLGEYTSHKIIALDKNLTFIRQKGKDWIFDRFINKDSSYNITNGKKKVYNKAMHQQNLKWNNSNLYKVLHRLTIADSLFVLEDGSMIDCYINKRFFCRLELDENFLIKKYRLAIVANSLTKEKAYWYIDGWKKDKYSGILYPVSGGSYTKKTKISYKYKTTKFRASTKTVSLKDKLF